MVNQDNQVLMAVLVSQVVRDFQVKLEDLGVKDLLDLKDVKVILVVQDPLVKEEMLVLSANQERMGPQDSLEILVIQGQLVIQERQEFRVQWARKVRQEIRAPEVILVSQVIQDKEEILVRWDHLDRQDLGAIKVNPDRQDPLVLLGHKELLGLLGPRVFKDLLDKEEIKGLREILVIQVVKVFQGLGEIPVILEHQAILAHKVFKDQRDPQVIQDPVEPLDCLEILVLKDHKGRLVQLALLDPLVLLARLVLWELQDLKDPPETRGLMHPRCRQLLSGIQAQLVLPDLPDCRGVSDR